MKIVIEELDVGTPGEHGADEHGVIDNYEVPSVREVCGCCDGEGTIVDPAIDGHGISAEEWDNEWDDESREAYFAGRYDVTCPECKGRNVVEVPAPERIADPVVREAVEDHFRSEAESRAEEAYWRRVEGEA